MTSHHTLLTKAIEALHARTFYAAYPEHPAPSVYGETADAEGQAKFKETLGKRFTELKQTGETSWAGQEESPYLQQPLNISYPVFTVDALVDNSKGAFHQWRKVTKEDRAEILIESLERIKKRFLKWLMLP